MRRHDLARFPAHIGVSALFARRFLRPPIRRAAWAAGLGCWASSRSARGPWVGARPPLAPATDAGAYRVHTISVLISKVLPRLTTLSDTRTSYPQHISRRWKAIPTASGVAFRMPTHDAVMRRRQWRMNHDGSTARSGESCKQDSKLKQGPVGFVSRWARSRQRRESTMTCDSLIHTASRWTS